MMKPHAPTSPARLGASSYDMIDWWIPLNGIKDYRDYMNGYKKGGGVLEEGSPTLPK